MIGGEGDCERGGTDSEAFDNYTVLMQHDNLVVCL